MIAWLYSSGNALITVITETIHHLCLLCFSPLKFIFGDFNPNEDFSTQFGLKVVMGLILALSTPSGCIGLLRIKPQSEAISIEGPAALLSTLSAEHLHLCHQILVISPNETDVIVQIRQKVFPNFNVPAISPLRTFHFYSVFK